MGADPIPRAHQRVGRKKHRGLMAPCRVGSGWSPVRSVDAGPVRPWQTDILDIYVQMEQMHIYRTIHGKQFRALLAAETTHHQGDAVVTSMVLAQKDITAGQEAHWHPTV